MLWERRGITYLCPQGEKSGTRGSEAAARCSDLRLLSSCTSPDDSLAFTHLRASDLFAAAVFFSPSVPRTYLSALGLSVWQFFFLLFLVVLGGLSCKNSPATDTRRARAEELDDSQGRKTRCEAAELLSHSKPPRPRTLGQTQPFVQALFRIFFSLRSGCCWWLLMKGRKKSEAALVISQEKRFFDLFYRLTTVQVT